MAEIGDAYLTLAAVSGLFKAGKLGSERVIVTPNEQRLDFSAIETATLGHFLVEGFMVPAIQSLLPTRRVFGPAFTVKLPNDEGGALVQALSQAPAGQILVIDRCGDQRHACWGAVTTAAARNRGLSGVVIDGFVTDLAAIEEAGFPVWCRGRSPLTTKGHGGRGACQVPVVCGGVMVRPGQLVLADENGVVVLDPAEAADLSARALSLQEAERDTLRRLSEGETLAAITAASKGATTTATKRTGNQR